MTTAPAPSDTFPAEMQAARRRRNWTQQQLAERLADLGAPLDRSTIAKVESRKRGVNLDEVFWIACALDVSPAFLLVPRSRPENGSVQVTPGRAAPWLEAMQWLRGVRPPITDAPDGPDHSGYEAWRFFEESRSDAEVMAFERWPELRTLKQSTDSALYTAMLSSLPAPNADEATGVVTAELLGHIDNLIDAAGTARKRLRRLLTQQEPGLTRMQAEAGVAQVRGRKARRETIDQAKAGDRQRQEGGE